MGNQGKFVYQKEPLISPLYHCWTIKTISQDNEKKIELKNTLVMVMWGKCKLLRDLHQFYMSQTWLLFAPIGGKHYVILTLCLIILYVEVQSQKTCCLVLKTYLYQNYISIRRDK